uniref:Uncharacterized protein n=1 Tax=Rhizophora mucronata TaxID=61149 RepID=A0A2P2P5S2_RHIMU
MLLILHRATVLSFFWWTSVLLVVLRMH